MYLNIIYWQKNEYKLKDAYLNTVPECSDFNSHICDKESILHIHDIHIAQPDNHILEKYEQY